MSTNRTTDQDLVAAALAARQYAYAPYSGYAVGAAVEADDGRVFAGCNVENASYGLTVCAERSAVSAAVAAGALRIRRVAVAASAPPAPYPCGACRQVLREFAGEQTPVLIAAGDDAAVYTRTTLGALLPMAFAPGNAPPDQ